MSSELVPFQRLSISEVDSIAIKLTKSGLFADVKDANQAFVKILAGQELGIEPFQAMSGIHIIKGKPVLSADLLAKLVKRSGFADYDVITLTDQLCELEFTVRGKQFTSTFSIADAQKAGIKSDMYAKYPRNMLFARALSNGVRWFCSDTIGGTVYTEGEIEPEPIKNITPTPLDPLRIELKHMPSDMRAAVYERFTASTGKDIRDIQASDADELTNCIAEVREKWVEPEEDISFGDELRIRYHAHGKKDKDKINAKYAELAGEGREPIQTLWKSDNEAMLDHMKAAIESLNTDIEVPSWDTLPLNTRHKLAKMYADVKANDWPEWGDVWVSQHKEALMCIQELVDVYSKEVEGDTNATAIRA